MPTIQTKDLTGLALDWAVAKSIRCPNMHFRTNWEVGHHNYSTDWSQGGPIIERERIIVGPHGLGWVAQISWIDPMQWFGPTPLIAAMRCFVASRLGDTVDIPKGLMP